MTGFRINITDPKDTAKSVRLRGLSINGWGTGTNGINVVAASLVSVEDCVIDGFSANRITVASGVVFVRNTTIRNNVIAGITVTSGYVGLADVALVFNGAGLVGATSVQSLGNVYMYGNKTGDAKPVR